VRAFSVDALSEGQWKKVAEGTTIGRKRILRFPTLRASKIRLNILDSKASPTISNIELFLAPRLLAEPAISRSKNGMVSITPSEEGLPIYFTTNGSQPDNTSRKYTAPFSVPGRAIIQAIALDEVSHKQSSVARVDFDISKRDWKVVSSNKQAESKINQIIDDNPATEWNSQKEGTFPYEVTIDLGETIFLQGFTYLPPQGRYIDGTIAQYEFYVSIDGKTWGKPISAGEFSNIRNNPVLQTKEFNKVKARFIKLKSLSE
jgi:alpha-L-fucosidase